MITEILIILQEETRKVLKLSHKNGRNFLPTMTNTTRFLFYLLTIEKTE